MSSLTLSVSPQESAATAITNIVGDEEGKSVASAHRVGKAVRRVLGKNVRNIHPQLKETLRALRFIG